MDAIEFLRGAPQPDGSWRFDIGRERHGAFGGAFGGLLAACTVAVARATVPGRMVASLDARFLRGLPAGEARLVPTVVHAGRSLTCVQVDVVDGRGRLATRSTLYLVDAARLQPLEHPGDGGAAPVAAPWSDGTPWRNPPGTDVPIVTTFAPRAVGRGEHGIATALRVPWDDDGAGAEAACLAADICVGPPVGGAFPGRPTPAPNPDLSLRFAGEVAGPEVVGWGQLERIHNGLAMVRIEVRSGALLLATGVSCSLVLRAETSPA
ncbi:MAG TPA: acyl-CoA thioesterase domain-containing protein [Acidimicrobiales bacterium]|nr:acyl-CoA thioesterase domain-containing protein [Acidimicrobiales bacterium]